MKAYPALLLCLWLPYLLHALPRHVRNYVPVCLPRLLYVTVFSYSHVCLRGGNQQQLVIPDDHY